ncbi:hypothetical protein PGTUg99_020667 [Puccinia graminis f. sp. tritici]|uniref:Uncharacterized protein n=1 Tax=Puccinia graminis f. sp. tritici TaxID=56615 RepID=A0A5B0MAP0_PUCGR|nr:hypothetical protein PGTUg99_020667 [Puccinia graminis f. sp. tritici]
MSWATRSMIDIEFYDRYRELSSRYLKTLPLASFIEANIKKPFRFGETVPLLDFETDVLTRNLPEYMLYFSAVSAVSALSTLPRGGSDALYKAIDSLFSGEVSPH